MYLVVLQTSLLVGLVATSADGRSESSRYGNAPVVDLVDKLLATVEDPRTESSARVAAIRHLGELKDRRAVPRLLRVLERKPNGVVTLAAVHALGQIGDRRAIPLLKEMELTQHGTINAAIDRALERLERP